MHQFDTTAADVWAYLRLALVVKCEHVIPPSRLALSDQKHAVTFGSGALNQVGRLDAGDGPVEPGVWKQEVVGLLGDLLGEGEGDGTWRGGTKRKRHGFEDLFGFEIKTPMRPRLFEGLLTLTSWLGAPSLIDGSRAVSWCEGGLQIHAAWPEGATASEGLFCCTQTSAPSCSAGRSCFVDPLLLHFLNKTPNLLIYCSVVCGRGVGGSWAVTSPELRFNLSPTLALTHLQRRGFSFKVRTGPEFRTEVKTRSR